MPQYTGIWTIGQASQLAQNGTWVGIPPTNIEYLIVAGGGGGGYSNGGGGGAGGLILGSATIAGNLTRAYITVGAGGNGGSNCSPTNG